MRNYYVWQREGGEARRRSSQEEEKPGGGGFRDSGHPGCPSPLGHVR